MLDKLLAAGPSLSRGVVRFIGTVYAMLYLIVYVKASTFLPDFIFRDAEKIQAQMVGADTYSGTSFDAVAKFYALFGPSLLNVFVTGVGVCFIWMMMRRANRIGLVVAALLLSVPCVFFNLFVASKDTLVVVTSLVLARFANDAHPRRAIIAGLALYGGYAALVRSYFMLIVVIAVGVFVLQRMTLRWKMVAVVTVVVLVALLPGPVYVALLHPRDMAVEYLVYQSPYGARTSFYNPVDPSTFIGFAADYAYAIGRLNFAALTSPGIKEFAMQIFVALAVWPALRRLGGRSKAPYASSHDVLAGLIIGHVCVSMLFEPDLGSYTRHLSSVALFSMTLLADRLCAAGHARRRSATGAARGT
ncbi:hypothetical protein WN982_38430 [Paraburkholderia sp. IMGN_8]|uniref:hypothetical protein n=1 Tax=Paraburkholderia sp. IMGN_8 TaxID=3136564 RepID=UPI003100AC18